MRDSLIHFLGEKFNNPRRDELVQLLESRQPKLLVKYVDDKEDIKADDLSDDVVRGISQIIYERDTAKDVDLDVPQQQLTAYMRDFNDSYIDQLHPAKFEELQGLIKSVVPSMRIDAPGPAAAPSTLPANVQIMINKYLRQHLPDDIKAGIAEDEAEMEAREAEVEEEEPGDAMEGVEMETGAVPGTD